MRIVVDWIKWQHRTWREMDRFLTYFEGKTLVLCLNTSGILKNILVYFVYYFRRLWKGGKVFFHFPSRKQVLWKQGTVRHTEGLSKTRWGGAPRVEEAMWVGKRVGFPKTWRCVRVGELVLFIRLPDTHGTLNKKQTSVVTVHDDNDR